MTCAVTTVPEDPDTQNPSLPPPWGGAQDRGDAPHAGSRSAGGTKPGPLRGTSNHPHLLSQAPVL